MPRLAKGPKVNVGGILGVARRLLLTYIAPVALAATLVSDTPIEQSKKITLPAVNITVNLVDLNARTKLEERFLDGETTRVNSNNYAVLLTGKPEDTDDAIVFGRNTSLMESLLNEQGYKTIMIDSSSSEMMVHKTLDALSEIVGDDDKLLFMYSGHGAKSGSNHYLLFSELGEEASICPPVKNVPCDDGKIYPEELIDRLSSMRGSKTILISACYSGGFSDYAKDEGSDVSVIVSAPADKKSYYLKGIGLSYLYLIVLSNYQETGRGDDPANLVLDSSVLEDRLRARVEKIMSSPESDRIQIYNLDGNLF